MLVTIYEKASGEALRVESIDAKECVAGGFYVREKPTTPELEPTPLPVIGGRRRARVKSDR
jgi:hypothetical protein